MRLIHYDSIKVRLQRFIFNFHFIYLFIHLFWHSCWLLLLITARWFELYDQCWCKLAHSSQTTSNSKPWQATQKLRRQDSETEVINFHQRAGSLLPAHEIVATHCIHVNRGMVFWDYKLSGSKHFGVSSCYQNISFYPKESTHKVQQISILFIYATSIYWTSIMY